MAILDRLSDAAQREKAMLQDKAIESIFSSKVRAVFHGGTAVWRCYGGERFSKDIDMYVKNKAESMKILDRLGRGGMRCGLLQERKADFGLYHNYVVRSGTADIALQITFAKMHGSVVTYETVNGAYRNVISLRAEEMLLEKLDAYLDRAKARDLYDMWILSRQAFSKKTAGLLGRKLAKPQKTVDYEELRHSVYGLLPQLGEMIEAILRRAHEIRE